MIDRKQFLGLMAGAPILMRAGMAEAVELPDAQKRLTLVVDTVVRDENGNEKTRTRSRETIFTPESKTVSADAMAGDVITIQRESDETLPLLTKRLHTSQADRFGLSSTFRNESQFLFYRYNKRL